MDVERFVEILGAEFYTGVPDSLLRPLCDYLMDTQGLDGRHHIIAANEGNCVGISAGYHLATGKVPVVYMQNSGEGNAVNPITSLLNRKVYAIPCIFIIGWRGQPDTHDEPQHLFQGEVTVKMLDTLGIPSMIIGKDTSDVEVSAQMEGWSDILKEGGQVAFVVSNGGFSYSGKKYCSNNDGLIREEVIKHIVKISGDDPIITTTGKASRELFEIRELGGLDHKYDFLTVGSMGHSSSIALGIAINKPSTRVWCIDGDGAVIMHLGSMAIVGAVKPNNMIHIVINNSAHESVGGFPTASRTMDMIAIAKACGYEYAKRVETYEELDKELSVSKIRPGPTFIEVTCSITSRADLGRPTTSAQDNKRNFMEHLKDI